MRKSIYVSQENDAALKGRFTGPDGSINYTQAINTALTEWREGRVNDCIKSESREVHHTGQLAAGQAQSKKPDDAGTC